MSKVIKAMVLFLITFIFSSQAMAASIPYRVYIDDKRNPATNIFTQKNTVTVRVYDSAGANHTVKVGSTVAENIGAGNYEVRDYPLKVGSNSITITVDSYKDTYNITYIDEALPGARYYTSSIPSSGTITAINGTILLKFPSNNYIINIDDPDSPEFVRDQGLAIEVLYFDSADSPTIYHQAISSLYAIKPTSCDLDGDSERADAAVLYPGELTIKYDAGLSSAAADTLTVVYIPYKDSKYDSYYNDFDHYWNDRWSRRGCVILGGRVDTSARTITVPFTKTGFGTYAVFNVNREFTDLLDINNHLTWARNYVLPLWAKGVMEKTGSGESFGNGYITREEFTTSILKAMGIQPEGNLCNPFEDLNSSNLEVDDYRDYILTAAKNGFICGFPESRGVYFHPERNLTREQAATIIARVAGLKISDSESTTESAMAKAFHDYSTTPDDFGRWATPYVYAAYKAGFIQGSPIVINKKTLYDFFPQDNLTRTEAAKLIYMLMKKQKKL